MALRRLDRPRAVVLGLENDDPATETIKNLFPHTDLEATMADVRQADYDVVFAFGDAPPNLDSITHIFWVGNDSNQQMLLSNFLAGIPGNVHYPSAKLFTLQGDRSSEFDITSDALALAPRELIETIEPLRRDYYTMMFLNEPPREIFTQTFLLTERGGSVGVIGIVAERTDNARQIWALPLSARSRLGEWLDAALQQWRARDSEAFPHLAWAAKQEWMDSDELNAAANLREHDAKAEATLADLAIARAALVDAQVAARSAADQGLRQLLTTNSDTLVDAVSRALEDFGFKVVDGDSLPRVRKFEDLQVFDGEWVCLAEVKGYERRNAKTSDLMQLAGAVSHYQEQNPAPSAQWYVINQSFAKSPDLRIEPFESDRETVEQFANNGGLVIDTRELFRLATRVHQGDLTSEAARELLREARGVFHSPGVDQA